VRQAAPLFLAEMSPPRWRGSLTACYQFFLALGVLIANLINYGTARVSWGWRVSLSLAGAPAALICVGALFLTDTPSSLVVRGPGADVDAELKEISRARSRTARSAG
jgi:MFS family permease